MITSNSSVNRVNRKVKQSHLSKDGLNNNNKLTGLQLFEQLLSESVKNKEKEDERLRIIWRISNKLPGAGTAWSYQPTASPLTLR